ncbi:MAG: 2,3-bisphosphoglycerate-independent phosphoglycerate mutase [Patescibacteria group bacterium]|nr:2,3-bisphosphoglycerate-independent phosphoglycerate mutase [Patescibacteria group bacterium]
MKKVALIILDGWGIKEEAVGNAVLKASTPNMDALEKFYPSTALQASGMAVGLPWNKMGNSEVGHLTLGAGKIIYQNLPRVSMSIQDRSFFENKTLLKTIRHTTDNKDSNLHLMGMLSDGGVHSHLDHLYALLELLKEKNVDSDRVFIHIFTDGRDTNPKSGVEFVSKLLKNMKEEKWPGRIASIMGRYYAMDRNENWERTKLAYYCLVNSVGIRENDPMEALKKYYLENITDEFIKPTLVVDEKNNFTPIKKDDSVIFFNIRQDRARQLSKAFVLDEFEGFDREGKLQNLCFTTMIEYEKNLPTNIIFSTQDVNCPLGKIISDAGMKQLRIAETEKYAHVTYFFNGGKEKPFKNEFRTLVPSLTVAQFDDAPKMSAEAITKEVIKGMESDKFNFILVNYANSDMVGHTGNCKAAIEGIEFVDECIGKLYKTAMENGFSLLITADHGNAEEMINPRTGEKLTEHTTNPVPFIIVDKRFAEERDYKINKEIGGILSDVAPTVLEILELDQPEKMTGKSLLNELD